jgi:hypothetical protein
MAHKASFFGHRAGRFIYAATETIPEINETVENGIFG